MARLDGGGAGAAAPSSSAVGDTTVAAPMGKPMLEIFSHRAGRWTLVGQWAVDTPFHLQLNQNHSTNRLESAHMLLFQIETMSDFDTIFFPI